MLEQTKVTGSAPCFTRFPARRVPCGLRCLVNVSLAYSGSNPSAELQWTLMMQLCVYMHNLDAFQSRQVRILCFTSPTMRSAGWHLLPRHVTTTASPDEAVEFSATMVETRSVKCMFYSNSAECRSASVLYAEPVCALLASMLSMILPCTPQQRHG